MQTKRDAMSRKVTSPPSLMKSARSKDISAVERMQVIARGIVVSDGFIGLQRYLNRLTVGGVLSHQAVYCIKVSFYTTAEKPSISLLAHP
jgi:hypothetical protein